MLTEVEIEGVGTMRQLNAWQLHRLRSVPAPDKLDATMAMALGMTKSQFRRFLTAEQKDECRAAWDKLMSIESAGLAPIKRKPQPPAPGEHVHPDRQVFIGRQLVEIRAKLPRGHFRRWVEENSGLSMAQANRFIRAAREAESRPVEREAA